MNQLSGSDARNKNDGADPIRNRKVWMVFGLLFFALLPLWPLEGVWWLGIPAWAAFAVIVSAFVSAFTVYVILCVWKDPEESESGGGDGAN